MAKAKKSRGVWGIDIGQCALKALRCTPGEDDTVVAEAFDYIEYPKVLSQPEADADELIREALEQFLERNEVKGDLISISVSGQAGLSRFFKPPPVDAKTIPNIVKYEARQQIPFALEDVIWDYQRIGGSEVDGFVMDAEIGIFAMKRDAVFRALQPYLDADMEIHFVQLTPLCIFNVMSYDVLNDIPPPEEIDPDDPPESVVVVSMGTETTDLVITNGYRLWQRNIPLGGNHFTKQLTKELKLTYAKAEHLKRNARQAEDPKTVFQVMRPVFNDLVTEIQRSIGYFQSIDREARVGKMIMLGNAVKLPGLRQYLSKNLGQEVEKLDHFERLSGSTVLDAKSFKDNVLSFNVCYGLCLQGLEKSYIATNLLPREFATERIIREKKPWAVVAVASLLLAMTFNFFGVVSAFWASHPDRAAVDDTGTKRLFAQVKQEVDRLSGIKNKMKQRDDQQLQKIAAMRQMGEMVVGNKDRQLLWLEFYKAILQAMPKDDQFDPESVVDPKTVKYEDRKDLMIDSFETQFFDQLEGWFGPKTKQRYIAELQELQKQKAAQAAKAPANPDGTSVPAAGTQPINVDDIQGPVGPGWVIQLKGHHFHNGKKAKEEENTGATYIRKSLFKNLREGTVQLPDENGELTEYTYPELGVGYAILTVDKQPDFGHTVQNLSYSKDSGNAMVFSAPKFDFVIQFCWQNPATKTRGNRTANRKTYDTNQDGVVDLTDVTPENKNVIESLLAALDRDKDGKLSTEIGMPAPAAPPAAEPPAEPPADGTESAPTAAAPGGDAAAAGE